MIVAAPMILTGFPTARGAKKHIKQTLLKGIGFWHRRFVRKHFTGTAWSLYGYKKRTIEYARTKQHRKGHILPMVFTGATRTLVSSFIRKSGTSRRGTGTMFAPFYVSMTTPSGRGGPILGRELVKVAAGEQAAIASFMAIDFTRRLNRDKTKRRARAS